MDERTIAQFYEEMRKTFVKPDSSWTDKGAIFRTILEKFFVLLTPELDSKHSLYERINAYYDAHPNEDREKAHRVRQKTNNIVHNRVRFSSGKFKRIDEEKNTIQRIYEDIVMIVFNATQIFPDSATFELLGANVSEHLKGLNDQQKDAILCNARIVFVNAGPGTGKTHLLVHELVHHALEHPDQSKLVALSFTNTAASHVGEQFGDLAFRYLHGKDYAFFNGTIHSFCLRNLRKYCAINNIPFNYMIIGDEDLFELIPEISAQTNGELTFEQIKEYLNSGKYLWPEVLSEAISLLKSKYQLISLTDILSIFLEQLKTDNKFSNWLMSSVDLVVIDEAQDLNKINFEILDCMLGLKPSLKLFLVGDPRQNIFEFNGGSYQHLDEFFKRHPGEVEMKALSKSYRCPNTILSFVNSIHFNDCDNIPLSSDIQGEISVEGLPNENEEAIFVLNNVKGLNDLNSCAILSHTIKGLAPLIDKLNEERIPYTVLGGKRRLKAPVRLINNLLRILLNNNEKSIRSVAKALNVDVNTQPLGAPRHFSPKELFYQTPVGRKLRTIAKDYSTQNWALETLAGKLIDMFVPEEMLSSPTTNEDFLHLRNLLKGYSNIKEYLDAFSVFKERFLAFYDKDFIESTTPAVDSRLTLSTIHSAKGLEWEHVFVIGMYDLNFPGIDKYKNKTISKQDKYLNNKKKEFYVASTRSRHCLTFTYPLMVGEKEQAPSRFVPLPSADNQ